jgi:hypothetical protein
MYMVLNSAYSETIALQFGADPSDTPMNGSLNVLADHGKPVLRSPDKVDANSQFVSSSHRSSNIKLATICTWLRVHLMLTEHRAILVSGGHLAAGRTAQKFISSPALP